MDAQPAVAGEGPRPRAAPRCTRSTRRGSGSRDGARVRVKSRAGEVTATLEVTDDMRPGVVSLPHGFGHAAAAGTLRVAGALAGPNVNVLTDGETVEPLVGASILSGVEVSVRGDDA